MEKITSGDAEIFYDVAGSGSPVVLLHPFPVHHEFWLPVSKYLSYRYRLIMPDLRGHGESGLGYGPATMEKHAADIARVMSAAGVDRAPLVGVSIGGYAIFEFWRRFRDRVSALVLCNTKAGADTGDARNGRLQSARDAARTHPLAATAPRCAPAHLRSTTARPQRQRASQGRPGCAR